jgi:hypothetical protein
VIGRAGPRYEDVAGLIWDVYESGRIEDPDPRIVAAWRSLAELEPPLRADGRPDVQQLAGLMEAPLEALGDRAPARPVWHCTIRAHPDDRTLTDDDWAQIASDVMDRTGLSPAGQQDIAARWVAIRHGDDHTHIVATLARQDGGNPRLPFDLYHQVSEACRAAEERYGLRPAVTGPLGAAVSGSRPGRLSTTVNDMEYPRPTADLPAAARSSWLGAILPGPAGVRGPRDPLLPEETAALARRVREVTAGPGIEVDVFPRRGGSLKVIPSHIPLDDEALALQLARIANSVRAAGLSAWWTDSGITVGSGSSSPVPPADRARRFLTGRLGKDMVITEEMIEIAQAVMPASGGPPPRAARGQGPRSPRPATHKGSGPR